MVERVLIQKKGSEFATVNGWVSWSGFDAKAYSIAFFQWPDLRDGHVDITAETLVVGGVGAVQFALRKMGVDAPLLDYPCSLRSFLGRELHPTTLAEVRKIYSDDESKPWFVKPRKVHKAFNGTLFTAFRDLIPTAPLADDLAVWLVKPVEFVSEWRYFVHRHTIIGVGHYRGDPFVHPDADTVQTAVEDFRNDAPVAYGIDFGVTASGRTLLVEVNDAYSLGHGGLRAVAYANMLEDRWLDLMARRPTANHSTNALMPSNLTQQSGCSFLAVD